MACCKRFEHGMEYCPFCGTKLDRPTARPTGRRYCTVDELVKECSPEFQAEYARLRRQSEWQWIGDTDHIYCKCGLPLRVTKALPYEAGKGARRVGVCECGRIAVDSEYRGIRWLFQRA